MTQEDGVVCSVQQQSREISIQVWPSFMQGLVHFDLEFVFWKWNCCWRIYWSANLQSCITTGIEVSWCVDMCVTIELKKIPT